MLEAPRRLLALAELALAPPEAPLKAPRLAELPAPDVCRLPTLSPPPRPALVLAALAPLVLVPDPPAVPRFIVPACAPPPVREGVVWRAAACRLEVEAPRAVPPYLLAVA